MFNAPFAQVIPSPHGVCILMCGFSDPRRVTLRDHVREHSHDPLGHLSLRAAGVIAGIMPETFPASRGRPLRRRSVPVIVRDGGRFDTDTRYRRTRATRGCQRVNPEGSYELSDFHRHGDYVVMFALPDIPQPLSPPGARSSYRTAAAYLFPGSLPWAPCIP